MSDYYFSVYSQTIVIFFHIAWQEKVVNSIIPFILVINFIFFPQKPDP